MEFHRTGATVGAPLNEVVALLSARPTSWLTNFLQIAIARTGTSLVGTAPPWYRLGPVVKSEMSGLECVVTYEASLTWSPHLADEDVFERFRGRFVAGWGHDGTVLAIEGESEGGAMHRNAAALAGLVELMSAALAAASVAATQDGYAEPNSLDGQLLDG
jgi:hypothetical protein